MDVEVVSPGDFVGSVIGDLNSRRGRIRGQEMRGNAAVLRAYVGSGRSPHLGAASKCEHWRSIDLADLKRMELLKPIVGDRIRAITWTNDHGGFDRLGIIPSARGIQLVKRDDEGKLAGLFVAYTYTPTMFGGCRKWFACPECRRPAPHPLWGQ
jgi:hypothetical protein